MVCDFCIQNLAIYSFLRDFTRPWVKKKNLLNRPVNILYSLAQDIFCPAGVWLGRYRLPDRTSTRRHEPTSTYCMNSTHKCQSASKHSSSEVPTSAAWESVFYCFMMTVEKKTQTQTHNEKQGVSVQANDKKEKRKNGKCKLSV